MKALSPSELIERALSALDHETVLRRTLPPPHTRLALIFPVSPTAHASSLVVDIARWQQFARLLVPALRLDYVPLLQMIAHRPTGLYTVVFELLLDAEHAPHFAHLPEIENETPPRPRKRRP